ncbi:MAG: hypothetical protein IJK26_08055 [Clostridia bacterium]|nr:hypothetical protein [Clostridia bacterium]
MNSTWTPIIVKAQRGKKSAFASIGNGKISFSQFACNLMKNPFQYHYVKVYAKDATNELLIGFEFIKDDAGESSYTLSRKRQKNKNGKLVYTGGFDITNKTLACELFGNSALGKTKTYDVTCEGENMLIIHLPS